jgi:hypothetical protein
MANFLVEVLYNFKTIFIIIGLVIAAAFLYHFLPDDSSLKCGKKTHRQNLGNLDAERYPYGSSLYPEY